MKKKGLIGLIIGVIVIIIGAAFVIGNLFYNKSDPKAVVLSALAKTFATAGNPEEHTAALLARLYGGGFKQEVTLGIDKLSGDLIPLEPAALSVAEVLTLANTTRRDAAANALTHTLSVRFAVTPLADVHLYADADTLAVNLPQAFDYFVTLDARHVARDWDASLLGAYVRPIGGMLLEDPFYAYYRRLLFTQPAPPAEAGALPVYRQSVGLLDEGTEYIYEGTEHIPGEAGGPEQRCDIYRVTVPEDSIQAYWQAVNPFASLAVAGFPDDLIGAWLTETTDALCNLDFDGGLAARVFVSDGHVVRAELTAQPVMDGRSRETELTVVFNAGIDSGTVRFKMEYPIQLACAIGWDTLNTTGDNFTFSVTAQTPEAGRMALDMSGRVTADHAGEHVDARIKKCSLSLDTPRGALEAVLGITYLLTRDESGVTYNQQDAVPLTRLSELDALAMYGRVMADPALGRLLGEVLP